MLSTFRKGLEAKFLEQLGKVKDRPAGWFGVHLRFSHLQEHYRSDYQLKISVNIINDLLKDAEGFIAVLPDYDIFLLCTNTDHHQLGKTIFQLRYLFMDDPIAYEPDGKESPRFCEVFDLTFGWNDFFIASKEKFAELEQPQTVAAPIQPVYEESRGTRVLTPPRLTAIEVNLSKVDITKTLRRQPVCAVPPNGGFRPVFEEVYINIQALAGLIDSDIDFTSNRWLFKYVTQLLDNKLIDLLKRNTLDHLAKPISLNLNIETLLSDSFAQFDRILSCELKKRIIIEIQISDVFADMAGFQAASTFLHKSGYRICLDGMSDIAFTQVDRTSLGFDLAKMYWNSDFESDLDYPENKRLRASIEACGKARMILCRCDGPEAIEYGQKLGISLFQGRYLDRVLNPEAKVVN